MATIDEIKKERQKKLESFQKDRILAYPGKTKRTHTIENAVKDFSSLTHLEKEIFLVGRIRAQRGHGGSTFLDIEDGTGKIQVFLKKDRLGEKEYQVYLDNFDIGDFIEIRGILFETQKGEKTIEAADFKMLAKSLLPLPEKWHGLQDVEERYRKRYLDLLFNPDVKKKFETRSRIINSIRDFLGKEEFLEVETPILQPLYGGATAKPFKTHLNALDMDLYLRIAPELYLKRLLVGGYEKIYEIGRCFRNEGMDKSHNPDFTMLEFYWAFADYKDLMKLTEKMFEYVVKKTFGKLEIEHEGEKINFKPPFPRVEFDQILKQETKINLEEINKEALLKRAKELGVDVNKGEDKAGIADEIYKKYCLPKILQPTFIINHPAGAKPLAKLSDDNPKKHASFQLIVAGWEIVNAYSEQNDPSVQRKAFQEQERFREEGAKETQPMDEDFLEALEYGMPPAAGFGMGIDRLAVLLTDSHSLREIILFPTMRPK